jgi:hypothetical protein
VQVCDRCTTRFALGLPRCPHCQSTDWLVEGEPVPDVAVPAPSRAARRAVSTSTIRAWARGVGLDVPPRGRLPRDVTDAYHNAHGTEAQET